MQRDFASQGLKCHNSRLVRRRGRRARVNRRGLRFVMYPAVFAMALGVLGAIDAPRASFVAASATASGVSEVGKALLRTSGEDIGLRLGGGEMLSRFLETNLHPTGTRVSIRDGEGKLALVSARGFRAELTLDPSLQSRADEILDDYGVRWGALVAIDPRDGRILASTSREDGKRSLLDMVVRSDFPAASLFKLVTAAAAIEKRNFSSGNRIHYRGGDYTLNRDNALPDRRRDRRVITFGRALARSCNPAFARIGVKSLGVASLAEYANRFGFNRTIPFDVGLSPSEADIPMDSYALARTAAGFGNVEISPLHAALITAAIGNRGMMMRPYVVSELVDGSGLRRYFAHPSVIGSVVRPSTASELLDMMRGTVSSGTARRQFRRLGRRRLSAMDVAAKTGTLRGRNPRGVYHWFVAVAPAANPRIALSSMVVDTGGAKISGMGIGKLFLKTFFSNPS